MNAVPDKTEMIEEQDKRIDEVLNSIKKRIVIFSGKGGVGKTTAAAAGVCFTETYGPVRGHFVGVHYSTLPGTSEWISSTGLIKVSGAVTGIVYMSSVTSIGSGGSWFPRTDIHTSTGGVRLAGSTETAVCDRYPVCNERITLSLFDTSTTGQLGTMYVIVKGQGTTG